MEKNGIKMDLKRDWLGGVWTGFNWLKTGTDVGLL
jgi:hypothetical protein